MPEIYGTVYGVEFHTVGKMYEYSSSEGVLKTGDFVLAMSEFGLDVGKVRFGPVDMRIDELKEELRPIVRMMTDEDWETYNKNKEEAISAMRICQDLIEKHSLPMRLLEARYMFDRSRIVFYFGADSRVDFRELVKDLARAFRTRIELRQIGVRDEARLLGGFGICGREQCCNSFIRNFEPISTQHAREQDLPLNPSKISGNCGRLLCCLRYEADMYRKVKSRFPEPGTMVRTRLGEGVIERIDVFNEEAIIRDAERVTFRVGLKDILERERKVEEAAAGPARDLEAGETEAEALKKLDEGEGR